MKYEGLGKFVKKSVKYTIKKIYTKQRNHSKNYKDILFINGCALPHPARYRVDHQIEQLHFNGFACDSVFYEELDLEMLKYYRGFIFFRCPHTQTVEEFILKAKYFNKRVFFDIDDLVIDYKYVKDIKYLKTMSAEEYELYMGGVQRMKKTLELCEFGITTTNKLAEELAGYVPEVYVNRNVASEKMVRISQDIINNKQDKPKVNDKIILGYFSGSITHNDDFKMILPVIKNILNKYPHVYLKISGILDVPGELHEFKTQIITEKFVDWTKLPAVISEVDINLSPLEDSIFNEAKSENKWVEAALVKVPTIASNVGAFKDMVSHTNTGILCNTVDEWEYYLEKLINDGNFRDKIAENAYDYVMENCISSYTGYKLFEFLESKLSENIAFVLPSTQISGGVNVVVKHCNILRNAGVDISIISMNDDSKNIINNDGEINVVSYGQTSFHGYFSKCVATLWSTVEFFNSYPKIRNKYYLVQSFETDFHKYGHAFRMWTNLTYNLFYDVKYITISEWCKKWLKEKFNKNAKYAKNGLDLELFKYTEKDFSGKIRIIIEGSSVDENKNVDESFKITNQLNKEKYEIWYLSYSGEPKKWYKFDKFFGKVAHEQVGEIYGQCHILLKSSKLESFSYPPLEMMATGGLVVASPNDGNKEYLKDRENSLLYKQGNIEQAVSMINELCQNELLRKKLIVNGLEVVKKRDWKFIEDEVLELYDIRSDDRKGWR
jgi:glycosyltransferase involved in cell wall biosynthesis